MAYLSSSFKGESPQEVSVPSYASQLPAAVSISTALMCRDFSAFISAVLPRLSLIFRSAPQLWKQTLLCSCALVHSFNQTVQPKIWSTSREDSTGIKYWSSYPLILGAIENCWLYLKNNTLAFTFVDQRLHYFCMPIGSSLHQCCKSTLIWSINVGSIG